ncbi:TIGR01244 family sulfur transferase [Bartonella sp. CB175]|uniref:TIGR01244 family sulfur transferase n=1 Tax=Bartonella sp. CB175 TaxID=3112256 RepID=UPI00300E53E5
MNLQQIEPHIFISGQISVEDIESLAKSGFKTIICNRPDQEDIHQPDFSIIKATAQKYGIKAYHIPIVTSCYKQTDVAAMKKVLETASLPLVSYCRSGGRSMHLYRLARLY